MNPIGNCQAKHSNEQEKKKGRDGAGNPGPVYGQKDQAPDPRPQQNKTRRQTEKSQTKQKQSRRNRAIRKPRGKETEEQNTKKESSNEGRTKGGEGVEHRLTARKGENHKGGVRGRREQL